MSAIEAELIKLFKFKKSPEDFEDHQEYLSELVLCVEKIKDDKTWDAMQEETYDWLTEAVEAKNKKLEIPDFTDAEPEGAEDPNAAEETGTDLPLTDPRNPLHREAAPKEDGDEEAEPTEVDEEAPEEETETEGEEGAEGQTEGGPDPEAVDEEATSRGPEAEPAEGDGTGDEVPVKKPRKKHVKAAKYIKKKKGKPDVQPKHKPGKEPDYKKITGTKDRYGVTEGTKTSLALKMFEKGCTMRDVVIELGDTQYNVLRKLEKQGHRIEKLENGVLRLIHKDDVGAVVKKGKGK